MIRSAFARAAALSGLVFCVTITAIPASADPSPTGRSPRLLWTPERQATWNRMKKEFDAKPSAPSSAAARWYSLAKRNADCACRYSDNGIWGTLLFQFTGDTKYANLAYGQLQKTFFPLTGTALTGNFVREYSAELVLMYDWLYPGLTDTQRSAFLAKLNELFTTATAPNGQLTGGLPYRIEDTDQTTGTYFGVVMFYLLTGADNPVAVEIYNRAFVGGLDATSFGRDNWRNAIQQYVAQLAAGGEWIESGYYNVGTVRLLAIGAESVRTATGADHFPEIRDFLRLHARRMVHMVTSDLKQTYQWGDEQFARNFADRVYAWQTTSGMVAGLTQDDPDSGPYLEQLIFDLDAKYGNLAEPWGRFFLLFNPYADRRPTAEQPQTFFASGQGLLLRRTGWTTGDSLFGVHLRPAQQTSITRSRILATSSCTGPANGRSPTPWVRRIAEGGRCRQRDVDWRIVRISRIPESDGGHRGRRRRLLLHLGDDGRTTSRPEFMGAAGNVSPRVDAKRAVSAVARRLE